MMFTINLLLSLQLVWAGQFPMWAICTINPTVKESQKVRIEPNTIDRELGINDVELVKKVLVRVWGVDNKCAWVYTGPKILKENIEPPLHCIPEKQCQPIFGGLNGR